MFTEFMHTSFLANVDAKALGKAMGSMCYPDQYQSIIGMVFAPHSAGYSIALRYADMEFDRLTDEQAELNAHIIDINDCA